MGGCGSKVLNFLVKIHIQSFVLQTSRNVLTHIIHKWGGHIWPFHDALRPHRVLTVRDRQQKKMGDVTDSEDFCESNDCCESADF